MSVAIAGATDIWSLQNRFLTGVCAVKIFLQERFHFEPIFSRLRRLSGIRKENERKNQPNWDRSRPSTFYRARSLARVAAAEWMQEVKYPLH